MVSVVKTVKNTERLRQILTVLAKHGFGELISRISLRSVLPQKANAESKRSGRTFAERLRLALQELGPSFVKLGQIVSTRPDLIPEAVITELKKLQDDVPPMATADVHAILEDTFSGMQSELFADFDDEPLASASIGQVHAATLRGDDGETIDVVVKIQRPKIRSVIERDLDLLHLLAALVERHIPESRVYSPTGMVAEFDRAITAELDFTLEADNAERFARNFDGDPTVRFPAIHRNAAGKRVLTMERFRGSKIYDFAADPTVAECVAKNALHVVAKMIFEHGFFHADPHPGNIIMLGDAQAPVIGLIDLGLVGRLSPELRDQAIALMVAAVSEDVDSLARSLLAMGRPKHRVDFADFRNEVEQLSQKYLGKPLSEIEISAVIRDLVQGAVKYDIDMPVELLMVGKALMTVEGIGKELYPELDVYTELKPYFMQLLWRRYSPERLGKDLLRGLTQLGSNATNLPGQVDDILNDVRAGRLSVITKDERQTAASERMGRRLFAAITTAAALLSGTALLVAGRHETLAWLFIVMAGLTATWSMWRERGPL